MTGCIWDGFCLIFTMVIEKGSTNGIRFLKDVRKNTPVRPVNKNGKRWNGKGTYYLPFGGTYEGEWKNGLKEGQGILTTETSEYMEKFITRFSPNSNFDEVIDDEESHISKTIKIIGEFKSDTIWNGNEYDEDGKIIRKYVNGEEIEE